MDPWTVTQGTINSVLCLVAACVAIHNLFDEPDHLIRLRWFVGLYSITTAVAVALGKSWLEKYYMWFSASNILLSHNRGFGSRGHPPFGFPLFRSILPALSPTTFQWIGSALIVGLVLNIPLIIYQSSLLGPILALESLLSFIYYTQTFTDSGFGMHTTIITPVILYYFATTPVFWGLSGPFDAAITLAAVELHMISLYLGAGLCKLGGSLLVTKWWGDGTTFHTCVISAMFARPSNFAPYAGLQRWMVLSSFLCRLASFAALVFECVLPVLILAAEPSYLHAIFFGSIASVFHFGTFALLGIDFCSTWIPALLVFAHGPFELMVFTHVTWAHAPLCLMLIGQLLGVITLNEATGGTGPLPFSCMPMFAMPTSLFGPCNMPAWFAVVDGDLRRPGHHGVTEWSGPGFVSHLLPEADMKQMPFRLLYFGHLKCPETYHSSKLVQKELADKPSVLFANFEVSKELRAACNAFVALLRDPKIDWTRREDMSELLRRYDDVMNLFGKDYRMPWD
eukprot:c39448_g1_i1.p1 GENE.c39448_g1_i1~~c39448_g1_i1.p1  ORF type:complete len:519 (+),score=78.52 c39448_g1_i1:29-1558(+)